MTKTIYKIDTSVLKNRADFDFSIVTKADVDEVLAVLRVSFFNLELIHNMLKAVDNPASIAELEQLVRKTVEDGVSVLAREKTSRKIVSVAANKIQVKPEEGKPGAFDVIAATFKEPESLAVMQFMMTVDGKVDMFAKHNTNTLFEIMFLGTLSEYCGRKIAKDICTASIQLATQTPAKAVCTLATSPWTERIAVSLGFELLYESDYSGFITKEGKKYSDLVGGEKRFTLRALPLGPNATRL